MKALVSHAGFNGNLSIQVQMLVVCSAYISEKSNFHEDQMD